ncbi:xylose-binding protein [Umezawaea tangerina]|uniref:Xylose-binding protein n=1 Tax=Umezawaea tangerina TaxID=84725 RepID=A0A2T0SPS5_9PSEU|nr:xylose-binding protein [Umezawaea tangerina]
MALSLVACGSPAEVGTAALGGPTAKPTVGVILPDKTSSARWETQDRPLMAQAFGFAGIEPIIENAEGDEKKFATLADDMIRRGVKVLIITPLTAQGGIDVERKAQAAKIPVIDYDRISLGGTAEYYVSFDNANVGELQAEGMLSCLGQKPGGQIIEMQGAPTDNNATLVSEGQHRKLTSKYDSGELKLVKAQAVDQWDPVLGKKLFDEILSGNGNKVDGVIAANDGLAGAVIEVLKEKNLVGKVPVTGQDATLASLQAILRGDQCMTVYKPIRDEAEAAARLAIALAKGDQDGADDLATGNTRDLVAKRDVKSILLGADLITKPTVRRLVAESVVRPAELCVDDLVAICKQNDIVVN